MLDYLTQIAKEYDAIAKSYCAVICIVDARLNRSKVAEDRTSARVNALTFTALASTLWGYIYDCEQTEKNYYAYQFRARVVIVG